eukprot:CAMPEP_0119279994 /NCGR_PEP_ID=MMETSP1329-20130426/21881_1 /TAXON_ID=114041 /ORGANISM="Genus nov. species nov., Strain RCC1024" /LENGTH=74 /DNA_ID=CAMNT_0007280565 /DNA_START=450 /DNA_END=671 /DNA_ORIENTATION=+
MDWPVPDKDFLVKLIRAQRSLYSLACNTGILKPPSPSGWARPVHMAARQSSLRRRSLPVNGTTCGSSAVPFEFV